MSRDQAIGLIVAVVVLGGVAVAALVLAGIVFGRSQRVALSADGLALAGAAEGVDCERVASVAEASRLCEDAGESCVGYGPAEGGAKVCRSAAPLRGASAPSEGGVGARGHHVMARRARDDGTLVARM